MMQLNTVSSYTTASAWNPALHEWDRVVGGGIMPSSLLILPVIRVLVNHFTCCKSAMDWRKDHIVYYFSTEESLQQVKQRAQRLDMHQ